MLGFIILIGTVVNNAILIVHQSLHYIREEGLPSSEAIGTAVEHRIRPIFMSVSTSVFAMLPLVIFQGQARNSIAVSVVSSSGAWRFPPSLPFSWCRLSSV